jgi:hypothetical protein
VGGFALACMRVLRERQTQTEKDVMRERETERERERERQRERESELRGERGMPLDVSVRCDVKMDRIYNGPLCCLSTVLCLS